MKALITGNRGFIGSHLQQDLEKRGWKVIGLDNNFHPSKNNVDGIIGNIRNKKLVDKLVKEVDVVFHCAAIIHVDYSIEYPDETLEVNIFGTLNILEAVRKYDKKMVFASSSEVYGSQYHFETPCQELWILMSEDHRLDAQSPYAASKVAGDRLCYSYWKTYGTKVAILRNFNTFGDYQADGSYGAVIGIFTRQALKGEPITIYGDGTQERDYMDVKDAVRGYELCIDKKLWGRPINIGTGKTIKIIDLAKKIIEITGSKSKIVHLKPRAGEVQRLCANIDYAKSLGFNPQTDFDKDLKTFIQHYEKNNKLDKKKI